jgi:hypothetical protein
MFNRVDQAAELRTQLEAAQSQAAALTLRIGVLYKDLAREPSNDEFRGQLRQAIAQLRSAKQSAATVGGLLANAAVAGLNGPVLQRLAVIRASAGHHSPAEFSCVERTSLQWKRLEGDLVAERRATRGGRPVPPEIATRLAAARAHEAVVAGRQGIALHLTAIRALFAQ